MARLVPFAVKLARYHAGKPAAAKKHAAMLRRRRRWAAKRKAKAELKKVLAMTRAAMGYKPLGRKLTPEHKAALHAGRDRYHQTKRKRNRWCGKSPVE